MKLPLHPDAVEFNEVECCAMERASVQEAHRLLIQKCVTAMGEVHPIYKASLFFGIFDKTVHLVFVPHAGHRMLYSTLASAEKSVLEQEKDNERLLDCGHTAQEHYKALDAINAKMAISS